MARNAENVSIRWRHHGHLQGKFSLILKASYHHTVRRCSVEIVTLNFDRQLGNAVSKTPVKVQNQRANLNPYLLSSCDLAVRLLTLGEYAIWCINRCNTGLEHMYRLECPRVGSVYLVCSLSYIVAIQNDQLTNEWQTLCSVHWVKY